VGTGLAVSPVGPKRWTILGGTIYHVNGTTSDIEVRDSSDKAVARLGGIDGAFATGYYPIFNFTYAYDVGDGVLTPIEIHYSACSIPSGQRVTETEKIYMAGGPTSYAWVEVLEE
jgi:hypothetical protein